MKEFLEKFKKAENQTQKTILFFGFYFIFFAILFLLLFTRGDKNYLLQEYEKGNSLNHKGVLNRNFLFDYKVKVDSKIYDYYGKRYGDVESFKYNNFDYYHEEDTFFVKKDSWEKVENPYVYYSFLDLDMLPKILSSTTFISKKDLDKDGVEYTYQISSNSLFSVIYDKNTDYDDIPNSILIQTDSSNNITKISYQLDSFCSCVEECKEHLDIEMNFEMFGSVGQIDNPTR